MQIFDKKIVEFKTPTVVTIGTFDGVHIGHQKIINRLNKVAQEKNLESTILTFFPHPRMVLQKDTKIKLINTLEEKQQQFKTLGLSNLVIKPFTKDFSRLTALEFARDVLVKELNTKHIIIGYDHHFGRNRTANINDLKDFGELFDFNVEEITAQDIDNVAVSSTKIRQALDNGNIEIANAYLGYNFSITGMVIKGKSLGKRISFPTANLAVNEDYKLIPKQGVYVVKSMLNNTSVYGMMNIGVNPTLNGSKQSIEVHYFNFNKSLYNKTVTVELLTRLRDEQKYPSINALKQQLEKDKKEALAFINSKC